MKLLDRVPLCDDRQVRFGQRLGLEVRGQTVGVATAMIDDVIDRDFWGRDLGSPTPKQVALAAQFGQDITTRSRRVGSAIIDDLMTQLNFEAIASQGLQPGDQVINKWDTLEAVHTISSIQPDGLVFFRGGNGKKAWARSLLKKSEGAV